MRRDEVKGGRVPLCVTSAILAAMVLVSAYAWYQLPGDARVPIHWGINGKADGYAGKVVGLLLLPGIMALLLALIWFISSFEPRRSRLSESWKAIGVIWIGLSLFLSLIHGVVIWAALGHAVDTSIVIVMGLGALLCVTGVYMGKVRSNYFVGVRTPWTLQSDLSWSKTNRLGGKLLVATGVIAVIAGFTSGIAVTLAVVLASVLCTMAITVAYSYRIWKTDPDRK
jgi:uncharacterized membrane protein